MCFGWWVSKIGRKLRKPNEAWMKEERNGGKRTRDVSHLEECLYVVTGSVRQTVCGKINQINLPLSL